MASLMNCSAEVVIGKTVWSERPGSVGAAAGHVRAAVCQVALNAHVSAEACTLALNEDVEVEVFVHAGILYQYELVEQEGKK